MPIGTSDGQYYDDELSHAIAEGGRAPLRITVTKQKPTETASTPTFDNEGQSAIPKDQGEDTPPEDNKSAFDLIKTSLWNDIKNFGTSIYEAAKAGPQLMKDVYEGKIDPNSDEALKQVHSIAANFGMGGIATAPFREAGVGIFGGRLGAAQVPATKEAMQKAEGLFNDKTFYHKESDIFKDTGVHFGPDGKPRFEISDKGARLKTENLTPEGFSSDHDVTYNPLSGKTSGVLKYKTPFEKVDWEKTKASKDGWVSYGPRTVGDIIDHPELFKHYPDLKDIQLRDRRWNDILGQDLGLHVPNHTNERIFIKGGTEEQMLSTLLHELQHAVQFREGHAFGGSPEQFMASEHLPKVEEGVAKLDKVMKERFKEEGVEESVAKYIDQHNNLEDFKFKLMREGMWDKMVPVERFLAYRTQKMFGDPEYVARIALNKFFDGDVKKMTPVERGVVDLIRGQHPDYFMDAAIKKQAEGMVQDLKEFAYHKYQELYGEYEARATQLRRKFNAEERQSAPHQHQDEFNRVYPDGVPEDAVRTFPPKEMSSSQEIKYTIETPANNKKGWRKVPDTKFDTKESAEKYGLKYHTDKSGAKMFRVVEME